MLSREERERLLALAEPFLLRLARRLVGRAGLARSDRDDIEQELRLGVWGRLHRYDAHRGDKGAFLKVLTGRLAAKIARHRRAGKRDWRREVLLSSVAEAASARGDPRRPEGAADRRLDLGALLARLPEADRELARSLATETVAGLARRLAVPPSTLRSRLRRLRQRFEAAGLRDYLPP